MSKKADRILDDELINRFRERLKIGMNGESNTAFAKKCGLSDTLIGKYLRGESYPSIDKLPLLAFGCGRSVTWLLGSDLDTSLPTENDNINNELLEWWGIVFKSLDGEQRREVIDTFKQFGKSAVFPTIIRAPERKEILQQRDSYTRDGAVTGNSPQSRQKEG